jgi:hypothetical protein
VDGKSLSVSAKQISCADAPSRARKLIAAGDLLISTVRPERRTIGVVSEALENAICTTGFAVLRCKLIDPIALAKLLQSDFAICQILRHNVGVAYPVVEEGCLMEVLLPLRRDQLEALGETCEDIRKLEAQLMEKRVGLDNAISASVKNWMSVI